MKKILDFKGVKKLSTLEQKAISGGFWRGCRPQIVLCESDRDCCTGKCGIVVDGPNGPINLGDVCAF